MFDISITSTKVRGIPKGRPNPQFNRPKPIPPEYPWPYPYSPQHIDKIRYWIANLYAKHNKTKF